MMMDTYAAPDAIARLGAQLPPFNFDKWRARHRPTHSTAHLSDPGLIERLTPTVWLDASEDAVEPVKRTRKRKPSIASVIRQMQRAGVEIAGVEVNPSDGAIMVRSGKPTDATAIEPPPLASEWDDVLIR
jgi:hypothetical protein